MPRSPRHTSTVYQLRLFTRGENNVRGPGCLLTRLHTQRPRNGAVLDKHKSKVNAVGVRYLRNVCGKIRIKIVSDEWLLKECGLKGNPIGSNKMIPLKDNQDVACFLVTKHSWKGKYKRIFSVGSAGITTYNPASWDVTNKWMYSDFINILPSVKVAGQQNNEFTITMKKDRKVDSMRILVRAPGPVTHRGSAVPILVC
uniref:DnaJ homologue subfamily C GRV2/DNAJC13 N-terminal domain-containing protein n=1 Tax=Timema shepardi TaxID=629360 RepID=A0A7R9ANC5_TIMSH|nr:unnamed protein product [Timema shepardi]